MERNIKNHLIAERIFLAGVDSVRPDKMIREQMKVENSALTIGDLKFLLEDIKNIFVIGAGKASAMMAREVEAILCNRITEGHIVVKYGHSCKLRYIKVSEAGHPIPDSNGFKATGEILNVAHKANVNDLVICLLSGGGSALLTDYPEGSTPEDLIIVNELLLRSGADIKETNTVRKHLSKVKGGQLAKAVYPAALVSLILSDVIGDLLDVIASGPTVPDTTTFKEAVAIIEKYHLKSMVPVGIINYLQEGKKGNKPETPKPDDPIFKDTHNLLIGTNQVALNAARAKAAETGLNAFVVNNELRGDSVDASEYIVGEALNYKNNHKVRKPVCLLFGGETTIKVKGNGTGGRNQHLALAAAMILRDKPGITILSAGTDGNDGPTDAAGAVVDSDTIPYALLKSVDPVEHLNKFDSYSFFRQAGGHIITGPTLTNVMDMVVVIVE